jgi:hypothetical protein
MIGHVMYDVAIQPIAGKLWEEASNHVVSLETRLENPKRIKSI